MYKGAVLRI